MFVRALARGGEQSGAAPPSDGADATPSASRRGGEGDGAPAVRDAPQNAAGVVAGASPGGGEAKARKLKPSCGVDELAIDAILHLAEQRWLRRRRVVGMITAQGNAHAPTAGRRSAFATCGRLRVRLPRCPPLTCLPMAHPAYHLSGARDRSWASQVLQAMLHEWRGFDPGDGSDGVVAQSEAAAKSPHGAPPCTAAETGLTFGVVISAVLDAMHRAQRGVRVALAQ